MPSLLNGLSAMGASVAQFAGAAGLEQQKAQIAQDAMVMADRLATQRQVMQQDSQENLQNNQQEFTEGENDKSRVESGRVADANNAIAQRQVENQSAANANTAAYYRGTLANQEAAFIPSDARMAEWYNNATPEQRETADHLQQIKTFGFAMTPPQSSPHGMAPTSSADLAPASSQSGTANASASPTDVMSATALPSHGAASQSPSAQPKPLAGEKPVRSPLFSEDHFSYDYSSISGMPTEIQTAAKALVEGRSPYPVGRAASSPFGMAVLSAAQKVDPQLDAATASARFATRKDFTTGKSADAVDALNTAMSHANELMKSERALNNFGGALAPINGVVNAVQSAFDDPRRNVVKMNVQALASEARKVFGATGGGSLTELQEWQDQFPVDGGPATQKAALGKFTDLLGSRLETLAGRYNRGMGSAEDALNLLSPHAAATFSALSGAMPTNTVGHQFGNRAPAEGASAYPPPPNGFIIQP